MPKIKYSLELKEIVIKEAKENKDWWYIANKYNITSGPALIRHWTKRYNVNKAWNEFTQEDEKMKKTNIYQDISLQQKELEKEYKEKIDKLEKEKNSLKEKLVHQKDEIQKSKKTINKQNKELENAKVKIIFLEKSIPSYLNLDMKEMIKTKKFKFIIFNTIWNLEQDLSIKISIARMCRMFNVSRDKYYGFKNRYDVKNNLNPQYCDKVNKNAEWMIDKYYETYKTASGANLIRRWIKYCYNINISTKKIRILQLMKPKIRPTHYRIQKAGIGKYSLQANVRLDLVNDSTFTNRPGQIIGMDGTNFKDLVINGKKHKEFCEVAYDWNTRKMIAYSFSNSETGEVVLQNLVKIHTYLIDNNYSNTIIQVDRGSGNCSNLVKDYEELQNEFVISMSKAGFKHNSVTESLNGWFKEQFYATHGYAFDSVAEFRTKWKCFVKNKNNTQLLRYNFNNEIKKQLLFI